MSTTIDGGGTNPILIIEANGAGTEVMRVTSAGLIGMGTTNPKNILDVNGGMAVGSYAGTDTAPSNGLIVSGNVGIGTASPAAALDMGSGAIRLGSVTRTTWPTGSGTGFGVDAGTYAYYTGGDVGFGTDSPEAALHIVCSGSATDQLYLQNSDGGGKTWAISDGIDAAGTLSIQDETDNKTRLVINGSGLVGIGTTDPEAQLHIECSGSTNAQLYLQNSDADGNTWAIGDGIDTAGDLTVHVEGSNRTIMTLHETNSSSRGLRVGAFSGVQEGTEAIGIGQFSDMGCAADATGLELVVEYQDGEIPPSEDISFQFETTEGGSAFVGAYMQAKQLSGANKATLALGTNSGGGSGATQAMFIDQNQHVGLGTSSPQNVLDVNGGVAIGSYAGTDAAPSDGLIVSGNVGIGTDSPSYQLQLSTDSAAKPTSGTWTIASDKRLKKDILPFSDGLDIVEKINPIHYRLNGKGGLPKDAEGVGILAEDMQRIAPYTVGRWRAKLEPTDMADTELLDFNPGALTFVLINAVKELQEKIKQLQAQMKKLQAVPLISR